jgi:hypothetical protein
MNTQKDVISGWIKGIFMFGVVGFMAYTTWHAVYNATADKWLATLSLFLFDGGAFSGYRMLVGDAGGSHQRASAQSILWIDFVLAAAMVAGALDLLPANAISVIILLSAGFNGWATYYYHTHDPKTLEQMELQNEDDAKVDAVRTNRKMLFDESMRQARAEISRQSRSLGTLMALRAQAELKNAMHLPMTEDEISAWNENIIDVKALPAPADIPVQTLGFTDFLKGLFTRGQRMPLQNTPSKQDALLPSDQSNTPQDVPQDNPQG